MCRPVSNSLDVCYEWVSGARGLEPSRGNTGMISSCLPQYLCNQLPSFPQKHTHTHAHISLDIHFVRTNKSPREHISVKLAYRKQNFNFTNGVCVIWVFYIIRRVIFSKLQMLALHKIDAIRCWAIEVKRAYHDYNASTFDLLATGLWAVWLAHTHMHTVNARRRKRVHRCRCLLRKWGAVMAH